MCGRALMHACAHMILNSNNMDMLHTFYVFALKITLEYSSLYKLTQCISVLVLKVETYSKLFCCIQVSILMSFSLKK